MIGNKGSNLIGFLIVAAVLLGGYFLFRNSSLENINDPAGPISEEKEISIGKADIKEKNFTGSKAVITGDGLLAKTAQDFIDQTIAEFKKSADEEVPDMRDKFGEDAPMANYAIEMEAKLKVGIKTESIVISAYAYTGGANGNSFYRAFTEEKSSGKILSLGDLIPAEKRAMFTDLVKKELMDWRPEGAEGPVVFEEDVKNLKFENLVDWSMDVENLNLYFDKYEVAPGALGAIEFRISLSKVSELLTI